MADIVKALKIKSHKGLYQVTFGRPYSGLENGLQKTQHLLMDANVARLHGHFLKMALASPSVLLIEAREENKSLEKMSGYILDLFEKGVKRGHTLVAVGGGILQDIVAFIAAVLFRGLPWQFYPTTLLAQADSCIGSKSSINVGGYKNQVGTFTPPEQIHISTEVLETLAEGDFRSGVGEMIKVHLIAGEKDFQQIKAAYPALSKSRELLQKIIYRSLAIKKELIEKDEFDRQERLILNYGHSFGHAIESATKYQIPHGIAITMGVDLANFVSKEWGFLPSEKYEDAHALLRTNYAGFEGIKIPFEYFLSALSKDKKNVGANLSLVLTRGPGKVFRDQYPNDFGLHRLCQQFFHSLNLS